MATSPVTFLSPDEYLEIERKAEFRSEYFDGQMFALAGGTLDHAAIAGILAMSLNSRVLRQGCVALSSDARVSVSATNAFFYPDLTVVCGRRQALPGRPDVLANPLLIVEILSPATEAFDRGLKFSHYRRIDSLREYVLVSQSEPRIETFNRDQNGVWTFQEFAGADAICRFESVNCEFPLSEIYSALTDA